MSAKTGSVLVVGGGISGVQTALDLAESGLKVYLTREKAKHWRCDVTIGQDVPNERLFDVYPVPQTRGGS